MYKQLDEFLVTSMPRIWRSRLLLIVGISLLSSFVFSQLKGAEIIDSLSEESMIFVSVMLGVYWLYLQYNHQPFLRRFSLSEVFVGSLLNLLCVLLIFAPLYFLENYYRGEYVDSFFNTVGVFFYLVGLPMVFLPFVIRNYSFTEILLIIVVGLLAGTLIILLVDGAYSYTESESVMTLLFLVIYVMLLVKVIMALTQRRYGRLDKWIIFFLIAFSPIVISFSYGYLMSSGGRNVNIFYFDLDASSSITNYFYTSIICFLFLLGFTWYVTRSFEKPMRVK